MYLAASPAKRIHNASLNTDEEPNNRPTTQEEPDARADNGVGETLAKLQLGTTM